MLRAYKDCLSPKAFTFSGSIKRRWLRHFSLNSINNSNDKLDVDPRLPPLPIKQEGVAALFPNCTAPFVFDNSRSHDSYKGNALIANRINLGPGGKHEKYNFWADNKLQPMISEDGAPKGMREVLVEREP
ncbi:10154_t:CDS:2 [Entrophospora sp. SA101]|nr:10154_t:CDS:2 [Entrophospora sp. SA101]